MLESIHTVSTEVVLAALGALASGGAVLTASVAKLWTWVDKRINDCEEDRGVLHGKIENMCVELKTISRTVGQMEGELKSIKVRNDSIDDKKNT